MKTGQQSLVGGQQAGDLRVGGQCVGGGHDQRELAGAGQCQHLQCKCAGQAELFAGGGGQAGGQ